MSFLALLLVLAAAFVHALWNYLFKRAQGDVIFLWLTGVASTAIYGPFALILAFQTPGLGWPALGMMAVSGVIHTGYSIMLQRGYRSGDLSLVYPLARGTGPLLSTLAAVLYFGERPPGMAVVGGLLIVVCIFFLTGGGRPAAGAGSHPIGRAVAYGIGCGLFIAAYTVWDRQAVAVVLVPPLLFDWGANLTRTLLFTPVVAGRRHALPAEWKRNWRSAFVVGLLAPFSYILVLTALTFAPVSYVAPAREVSILFGTLLGTHFLREHGGPRRLLAAAGMVLGLVALTWAY